MEKSRMVNGPLTSPANMFASIQNLKGKAKTRVPPSDPSDCMLRELHDPKFMTERSDSITIARPTPRNLSSRPHELESN